MNGSWGRGLLFEARTLFGFLGERSFLVLTGALFLLGSLFLQLPSVLNVDIGAVPGAPLGNSFDHLTGQTFAEQVGRPYDLVFLERVYPEERDANYTFRWSEPDSALVIHGVAGNPLVLHIRMHGAVAGPPTVLRLEVEGQSMGEFTVGAALSDYAFVLAPGLWSGDTLRLDLRSTPFRPGGQDPRALGVALDRLTLFEWRQGWWLGIAPTAVFLTGTVAFLYLSLRRAGLRRTGVTLVGALFGGILLVALLFPAWALLAAYAGGLFLTAALSYPVLLITLAAARSLFRRSDSPPDARTWTWLAVLFLIAFLLRFGGALSPRYASHDGLFHANRLLFAERGDLFFEHQSIEAGMRSDPYPGALYLTLVPLTVVIGDRDVLLAFFLAWLAAGEVFLFWFLARQVVGARASRLAALLYLAFPIGLSAFWFGIYANLFADAVVLAVAVAVVLAWQGRISTSPLPWVPLFALLFLAHFGTVILWIPLTVLWGVLLYGNGDARQRSRVRWLGLSWGLGLLLAGLVYYSYYYGFFSAMGAAVGAAVLPSEESAPAGTASLLVRMLAEARVWWRWGFVVDYAGLGLFLGPFGLALFRQRYRRSAVILLVLGMVVVASAFWAISMLTSYFTRYMLFLLPVAALGCGQLLALLWERGRTGRVVAVVIATYVGAMTLALWLGLCLLGLHPPHVL